MIGSHDLDIGWVRQPVTDDAGDCIGELLDQAHGPDGAVSDRPRRMSASAAVCGCERWVAKGPSGDDACLEEGVAAVDD